MMCEKTSHILSIYITKETANNLRGYITGNLQGTVSIEVVWVERG